ncbi:MAG: hypothetical protein HY557_08790 [Euryarchaeota archaeon]|nr:hypothetical protein [Euryarchaeota archaeon]
MASDVRNPSGPRPIAACDHDTVEYLGSGGSATFLQCVACGTTLVTQGGRRWALRPRAG